MASSSISSPSSSSDEFSAAVSFFVTFSSFSLSSKASAANEAASERASYLLSPTFMLLQKWSNVIFVSLEYECEFIAHINAFIWSSAMPMSSLSMPWRKSPNDIFPSPSLSILKNKSCTSLIGEPYKDWCSTIPACNLAKTGAISARTFELRVANCFLIWD